jgi:hypothetical protein
MRSWLTDPAGSVSPYRSCLRRICFALPILLSPGSVSPYRSCLRPDLFRPTDPAFAGSVSPYRSCFRRICFALSILPSPDLFRPTDPAFAGSVSPYPVSSVESTVARSAEINSARICVTPYCQASPLRLLGADDLDQTFDYLIDLFRRSAAESLP